MKPIFTCTERLKHKLCFNKKACSNDEDFFCYWLVMMFSYVEMKYKFFFKKENHYTFLDYDKSLIKKHFTYHKQLLLKQTNKKSSVIKCEC